MSSNDLLSDDAFLARLRAVGAARYHDKHPFHLRMHAGELSKDELRTWLVNRWYYQTRIPVKDALILSKSEDPAFRRWWRTRLVDHDGAAEGEGGLAQWLRLAEAAGLDVEEVRSCRRVVPAVRFACDAYVSLVRERSLVEAVASSLTEMFAPDTMAARIAAWEKHYPWVDLRGLAYFRSRVTLARRDAEETIRWLLSHATSAEQREACVAALERKCDILWAMVDGIAAAASA